jgi:RNA polymerase sigma-70 factor (ECF subfamily)
VATRQTEFERIAMPHTGSLLRVARRLTSEPDAAEDLVQETMLLAWRSFHQFQAGTNARAWLFRILINSFYAQRRKSRAPDVALNGGEVANEPNMPLAVDLGRALGILSVEHRLVVMLGIVEGFTCQEMAEMLEVPIGTVMSRLNRAREKLRGLLEPESARAKCAAKEA